MTIKTKKIGTGDAPCGGCGKHIYNIPLDLVTQESDGNGGYWFKVDGVAQKCQTCGEELVWYHKPAPITHALFSCAKKFEETKL